MQSRRWPHYLGDNMPVDLAELQRAMSQNNQAMVDFEATENPYTYAQELRGGQQLTPDATTGYLSPLMVLADTINQSTGRRDVRNLESERKGLSQTMAASQALQQQYDLEGEEQKRTFAQNQEDRAAAKEVREANKEDDRSKDSKTFVANTGPSGPNGRKAQSRVTAVWDPMAQGGKGAYVTQNPEGETVELNMSEWTEEDTTGYSGSKDMTRAELKEMRDKGGRARTLNRTIEAFDPSYIQFGDGGVGDGVPTKLLNQIMESATKNDLLKYSDSKEFKRLDDQQQRALLWWGDLMQGYSLQERHDLFGATLTNNEFKSWEQAFGVLRGMKPAVAKARLGIASARANVGLSNDLNVLKAKYGDIGGNAEALDLIGGQSGLAQGEDGSWSWDGLKDYGNYIDQYGNLLPATADQTNGSDTGRKDMVAPNQFDIFRQTLSDEDKAKFDMLNDANKQAFIDQGSI